MYCNLLSTVLCSLIILHTTTATTGNSNITFYEMVGSCYGMNASVDSFFFENNYNDYQQMMLACWEACYEIYGETLVAVNGDSVEAWSSRCYCQDACNSLKCDGGSGIYVRSDIELPRNCNPNYTLATDYNITFYENVGSCKGVDLWVENFEEPDTADWQEIMLACWEVCYKIYGDRLIGVDGPCFCQDACDELECDMSTSIYVRSDIELPINCDPAYTEADWYSIADGDGCTWEMCTDEGKDCYASKEGEPQTCALGLLPVPQVYDNNSYKCCGVFYEGCWFNTFTNWQQKTCPEPLVPVPAFWDDNHIYCCGIVDDRFYVTFDDDGCTDDFCTDDGLNCHASEDWGEPQTCSHGFLPVVSEESDDYYKCCVDWSFSEFDSDGCTWKLCTDEGQDCRAGWGEPKTCANGLLPVPFFYNEYYYKCCGVDYEGCTEDKCSSMGDDCWAHEEWGEPQTCYDDLLPVTSYWDESFYRCCGSVPDWVYSTFDDDGCTMDLCTDGGQDCYGSEEWGEPQTCSDGLLSVLSSCDGRDYGCDYGYDYKCCADWSFSLFDDDGCTWKLCNDWGGDCYASEEWGEPQTCSNGLLPVPQADNANQYKCCGVDYAGCTEDKCSSIADDCWANDEWGEPQTCYDDLLPITSYWNESFYRCCGVADFNTGTGIEDSDTGTGVADSNTGTGIEDSNTGTGITTWCKSDSDCGDGKKCTCIERKLRGSSSGAKGNRQLLFGKFEEDCYCA